VVIPSRLPEYLIAAMVIILAPGPSVLFVIARAIAWGRKTAVFSVALGLGPILQRSELAYIAVQWGGGLYLIYLGIDAIRKRTVHAADMTNQGDIAPSARRSMWDGYWVGALNPKGVVFFAAVLPQFIDRGRGSVTSQLILLGGIFAILAFISDGTWGLLAGTARNWLATDGKRLEKLRATGGVIMIILGLGVLYSAIVSA
jgi:threonine/homoserine/homoserine lactone efflux protein